MRILNPPGDVEFSQSIGMESVVPIEWAPAGRRFWTGSTAFADHAAEFYLGASPSSASAIRWAFVNYENRPTDDALALLLEAEAVGGVRLCSDDGRPSTHARLGDARLQLMKQGLLCNP